MLILVLNADKYGRVSGLSQAQVSKVMGGISSDRFRSLIKTLQTAKLLRAYVPGVTGKALFGKVSSAFYLNYEHTIFAQCRVNYSYAYFDVGGITGTRVFTTPNDVLLISETTFLIKAAEFQQRHGTERLLSERDWMWFKSVALDNVEYAEKVLVFFTARNIHDQFQLRLYELASLVLSQNWSTPSLMNVEVPYELFSWDTLMPALVRNASEKNDTSGFESRSFEELFQGEVSLSDTEDIRNYRALIQVMGMLAVYIAKRYKRLLQWLAPTLMVKDCLIIPNRGFQVPLWTFDVLCDESLDSVYQDKMRKKNGVWIHEYSELLKVLRSPVPEL